MLPEGSKIDCNQEIRQTVRYGEITKMIRNDVDKIIIATDAGREGELVARWIIDKSESEKADWTSVDFIGDG